MVPSTKINSPENLNLYCQVYCQVAPPTKISSLEKFKKMKISRIMIPQTVLVLQLILGYVQYRQYAWTQVSGIQMWFRLYMGE